MAKLIGFVAAFNPEEVSLVGADFAIEDNSITILCLEYGDLRVLVQAERTAVDMICQEECESEYVPYEMTFATCSGSVIQKSENHSFDSLLEHFMDGDCERYEIWRHNGDDGLYDAATSEYGHAFLITNEIMDNCIFSQLTIEELFEKYSSFDLIVPDDLLP